MRIYRCLTDQHSWQVTKVYSDEAISGASRNRPGFLEMVRDAEAGAIDVVVAESLDRLGRKLADIADVFDRLHFRSVRIHTVQQGEVSQMHVGILGTMYQMFLSDLRAKTHRGLEGLIRQGKSAGGLSYGYRAVADAAGRGRREIEPAEADVVRRIFREYAEGRSPKAIAHALNAAHVSGPRGGVWAATTINGNRAHGTGILNNRLYIGELVWNRRAWMKDPATGKRVPRMNAAEDVIIEQVPQLRIVDDGLWGAVRARQKSLTRHFDDAASMPTAGGGQGFWAARRPRHVFSGLLKCGVCGAGFAKSGARHFGCTAARTKGATVCSNRLTIRDDVLENTVITAMRDRLMDPDVFRVFAEEFVTEWNKAQAEATAGIAGKQAELGRIDDELKRLVDAVAKGTLPDQIVKERADACLARKAQLDLELASAEKPAPRLHPHLPELYRERVASLAAALAVEDATAARDQLRTLIEEITLEPENGRLRVQVRGELGAILRIADVAMASDEDEQKTRQVKLVAGTGFEPVTFRL